MRIGIIGGGAAGLAAAWLLEEDHEVTLFEKDGRLGGHAHTIDIEVDGQELSIDAGFQFFAPSAAYATFNRLLDELGIARTSYPATLTVSRLDGTRPVVMPPLRTGRPVWASLTPRAIVNLVRFRAFLSDIPAFLAQHDTTLTIAEYVERKRLPKSFVDGFLFPLLLAFWCVELADFRRFAAYNALYYLGANLPRGLKPPEQSEIPGGLRVYVDALVGSLVRTAVRTDAGVDSLTRSADGAVLVDVAGTGHPFDHVVLACNARQAHDLLATLPEAADMTRQLARFEYFDTTIAIHGDRRLMPRDEAAWSVVNARADGAHSSLSIWSPARGVPVFKSWVTYDAEPPQPLYATATYQHGLIDTTYFDAQRRLRPLQGNHDVSLAGLYTADADSHESAILSAVAVAERLAPESHRLTRLRG
ncbi:FAD-dependent oxidoreductase [Microbacterium allomyrinae]|uniref:FAD-dependent oxidoreductase n=1 Tax=Microbacterium allomyrinae TaxID=2830666 RepID=A0A9X1LUT2_9MICO|nr:FAD-dependent oxidoreductase [Microbacterium allomyrinae]MCC2032464.1 FAD-dependent oxidoreductase [Microbacterium allomyrinae]